MKEYKTYVCECCGKEFSEKAPLNDPKQACEACENNHATPVSVSTEKRSYKPGIRYPSIVTIEFDNGAVCTYYAKN